MNKHDYEQAARKNEKGTSSFVRVCEWEQQQNDVPGTKESCAWQHAERKQK
jgi:hypothetical protein